MPAVQDLSITELQKTREKYKEALLQLEYFFKKDLDLRLALIYIAGGIGGLGFGSAIFSLYLALVLILPMSLPLVIVALCVAAVVGPILMTAAGASYQSYLDDLRAFNHFKDELTAVEKKLKDSSLQPDTLAANSDSAKNPLSIDPTPKQANDAEPSIYPRLLFPSKPSTQSQRALEPKSAECERPAIFT